MILSEMNLQEKEFWERLPKNMQSFSQVTNSHQERLRIVQDRLKDFFGDRADWKICLEKYYKSDTFHMGCRKLTDIETVPELTETDIHRLIRQAEADERQIEELLSLRQAITDVDKEKSTTPEMYRAAEILGFLPNCRSGLNSWYVDFSDLSETERNTISEKIENNSSVFSIVLTTFMDFYLDGFTETYPQCGTVLIQPKRRYYYRGENAFYGSSKPSLARNVDLRLPDRIIKMLLWLRLNEGCLFLDNFDAVRRWPIEGCVNYIALAQHYGLRTTMMDVTSDLKTALFFACCKYENGKWRPLKKSEIAEKNSRNNIAKHGGDSRYAILYRSPTDITDMLWATQDNLGLNIITPIGYQPFMRCSAQHGYMLITRNSNYDMMRDEQFEKFKIRLSDDLCRWIFEEMEGGDKVYPHNDIPDISSYFDAINQAKRFSEDAFKLTAEDFRISEKDYDTTIKELSKYGIFFIRGGKKEYIEYNKLQKINKKYSADIAIKTNNITPISRPMIILGNTENLVVDDNGQLTVQPSRPQQVQPEE